MEGNQDESHRPQGDDPIKPDVISSDRFYPSSEEALRDFMTTLQVVSSSINPGEDFVQQADTIVNGQEPLSPRTRAMLRFGVDYHTRGIEEAISHAKIRHGVYKDIVDTRDSGTEGESATRTVRGIILGIVGVRREGEKLFFGGVAKLDNDETARVFIDSDGQAILADTMDVPDTTTDLDI